MRGGIGPQPAQQRLRKAQGDVLRRLHIDQCKTWIRESCTMRVHRSTYVRPRVNWNEFFWKPGGGSFRKVSMTPVDALTRLETGIVNSVLNNAE